MAFVLKLEEELDKALAVRAAQLNLSKAALARELISAALLFTSVTKDE